MKYLNDQNTRKNCLLRVYDTKKRQKQKECMMLFSVIITSTFHVYYNNNIMYLLTCS
jgi:hypothetical protein